MANKTSYALLIAAVILICFLIVFFNPAILVSFSSLFGVSNPIVVNSCPQGYIPSGDICCLDKNKDNVCDAYETTTTLAKITSTLPQQTTTTTSAHANPTSTTLPPSTTTTHATVTTTTTTSTTTTQRSQRPKTTTSTVKESTTTLPSNQPTTTSTSHTTSTTAANPAGASCGNGVFESGEQCETASDCGDSFHKCVGCKCVTDCGAFCDSKGQGYTNYDGISSTDACLTKAADVRGANENCYYKCSMAYFLSGVSDTCCCVKTAKLQCTDCPCTEGVNCPAKCATEAECEAKL